MTRSSAWFQAVLLLLMAGLARPVEVGAQLRVAPIAVNQEIALDLPDRAASTSGEIARVTLQARNLPLADALSEIGRVANVRVMFGEPVISARQRVSVRLRDVPVAEALHAVLRGTPFVFEYDGGDVALVLRHTDLLSKAPLRQGTISGVVTDGGTQQPLSGASIAVVGTSHGTLSGPSGRFVMEGVPAGTYEVRASMIGYTAAARSVTVVSGETSSVSIALQPSAIALEGIVAVGYGTQEAEEVTGSLTTINTRQLQSAPVAQVTQMLQGKLSGVKVSQTTGRPGEGMNVQVRGAVSITAGANPLYVVDGMPITGDISHINPAEIEAITVLKDAAATSLYGSRGANGVVLVETVSGVPGQTRMAIDSYVGYADVPRDRRLEMMDAAEYAQFQKEIDELNGRTVDPEFQNPAQYGAGTDWFDVVTQRGTVQSHNLSVTTGSERFNTAVTGGYFGETGVVRGTGYERFSLRVNTSFRPTDRLNLGFNVAPSYSVNTNFNTDGHPYGSGNIISSALITTPLATPYDADGNLALTAQDPATFANPNWLRVVEDVQYDSDAFSLLSNAFAEYELLPGFNAKTTANIQLDNASSFRFNPSTIGSLFNAPPTIPSARELNARAHTWVNENTVNYETEIGEHGIDVLGGVTFQGYRGESASISASRYPDDKISAIQAAGQVSASNGFAEWGLISYLARLTYDFRGRYLLSGSVRRDGSSRFGPQRRWGNFGSASAGWIVSEEPFWTFEPISFLKLRGSYGTTGNSEIGNYTYVSTLGRANYAFGDGMYAGRAPQNLGNDRLGWEKNTMLDLGADLHLLDGRVGIVYDYYSRRTTDLLFNVEVPVSSGFNRIQTNIGELAFWGHELGIRTTNLQNQKASWSTDFNISFDRNRVESLSTADAVLYHGASSYGFYSHISQVGEPLGMFWGAVQDGVYVDQQDFDSSPKHASSQVGTIKFKDLNGDGVVTFPEDYTVIGSPWPDFTYGMTNNLTAGRFDMAVSIAGSHGNEILAHHENWTTNLDGVFNVLDEVKNRWKSPEEPGDGKYGSVQQGTTFLERDRWHTRFIKPGSFLSVKNITLGYTLPVETTGVFSRLRVYGSAQNGFLFTRYPGPNPEVNTRNSASGSTPGFDENSYPVPMTLSIGVNASF